MNPAPDVAGTVFEDVSPELSRTYAEALLGAAEKEGRVDDVLGEIDELLDDVWRAQPKFAAILSSPSIATHEKDRILVDTLERRAQPTVMRFLRVLNRHGRLAMLPAIARRARGVWDHRQNRRPVTIRSAVPLDPEQTEALRNKLAALLQASPVLTLEVDPSLIGGLVVQVGDDVYDASIRSHLERLHRRLVEEKIHELQTQRDTFAVTT
jgi:F-type H+-transporting ATPase subunit delta